MKKYLLCFGLLGLYAGQAQAVDTVFSDAFVAHLDKCEPFADSYSDYVRELKTQTTSTILGKRINGDCEVEIETTAAAETDIAGELASGLNDSIVGNI